MKFLKSILLCSISLYANNILSLDLEELSNIEVDNTSATLTTTSSKNIPATTTIITAEDILNSGARNLDELLEIYVPSFYYMYKVQGSQMGMRGIISDRNNKILLLINNRKMNIRAIDGGALSERWISTLGDIKKITVITGPGSAIYGAGAIAGVISIETFNGKTNNGFYSSVKSGSNEDFMNAELSYGSKLKNDSYLYIYYGVDKYNGADEEYAPMEFAFDYSGAYSWNNEISAPAYEPYPYKTTNNNGSLDNEIRHKFHFQIDNENFTFWTRFTHTSLATPTDQPMYQWIAPKSLENYQDTGTQNQQLTIFTEYRQNISDKFKILYDLSYLRSDVYTNYLSDTIDSGKFWGEDNVMAKILGNYTFQNNNKLALGIEYNYNWFGRPSDLISSDYSHLKILDDNTTWNSYLYSAFGEYQAQLNDNLIMFIGGRIDKHKYTPYMYSPRIAFIYNIENRNIFKLNFNRSQRHSDDADLYLYHLKTNDYGDVEKIDTLEFIYSNYTKNNTFTISTFYNDHDVVAYNKDTNLTQTIGNVKSYGAEIEFSYKNNNKEFYISHSYTKLLDLTLRDNISIQNISASVYGYGDDFANWPNHITKIRFNYKASKKLKWSNSLRIIWNLKGGEDMADYNKDNLDTYSLPYYDDDTKAWDKSVFLDSGLIWNVDTQTVLSINGYNLLGILDKDYNKRNFFQTSSQFRLEAPALAIGFKHKF